MLSRQLDVEVRKFTTEVWAGIFGTHQPASVCQGQCLIQSKPQ